MTKRALEHGLLLAKALCIAGTALILYVGFLPVGRVPAALVTFVGVLGLLEAADRIDPWAGA